MAMDIRYRPSPILWKFHQSNAFYRGILGPVRSGKSTACSMELMKCALLQARAADGVRRSRWAAVRNTYRELSDTTLATWLMWFPEREFGRFNRADMVHHIRRKGLEMDVLFRALDTLADVKKLLSLELTGAWVNEAREVPKGIIDALGDRVGQYPAQKDGGCTWRGVILDTNAPDDDHWWYKLAEESDGSLAGQWEFFRQPGGLLQAGDSFVPNPAAENLSNIEPNYYLNRIAGKAKSHILVYYCAQYGFTVDGKAVIPEYVDNLHCAAEPLKPVTGIPIRIGLDFGLTPAAIFGQRLPIGRWIWFKEATTEHMGAKNFAVNVLIPAIQEFKGFAFETIYGDPAGNAEAQTDEATPFQIINTCLANAGIKLSAMPAPSNDFTIRRESLAACLTRLVDGKPGLIISPSMKITRKGLGGGYCFKRIQVAGDERFQDKPDKNNKFSHPVEAGEYMLVGAGEGLSLVTSAKRKSAPVSPTYRPGGWLG